MHICRQYAICLNTLTGLDIVIHIIGLINASQDALFVILTVQSSCSWLWGRYHVPRNVVAHEIAVRRITNELSDCIQVVFMMLYYCGLGTFLVTENNKVKLKRPCQMLVYSRWSCTGQ